LAKTRVETQLAFYFSLQSKVSEIWFQESFHFCEIIAKISIFRENDDDQNIFAKNFSENIRFRKYFHENLCET
jgi:hypothetical protein